MTFIEALETGTVIARVNNGNIISSTYKIVGNYLEEVYLINNIKKEYISKRMYLDCSGYMSLKISDLLSNDWEVIQ